MAFAALDALRERPLRGQPGGNIHMGRHEMRTTTAGPERAIVACGAARGQERAR